MTNEDHGGTSLTEVNGVSVSVHAPKLPHAIREGDVFRFSYSEAERKKAGGYDLNWAFDGKVVMRDGKLCDTYWGYSNGDPRIVRPDQGELTFICNLNDVRDVREYETLQYDEADSFNLSYNHGCNKRFVVRKDAKPSAARMLDEVRKKEHAVRQEMESAVRHGATTLVQLGEMRAQLEVGDLSKTPWWSK